MKIKITDIFIYPRKGKGPIKANVKVIINDTITLGGIKVREVAGGYHVLIPDEIVFLDSAFTLYLFNEILERYHKAKGK